MFMGGEFAQQFANGTMMPGWTGFFLISRQHRGMQALLADLNTALIGLTPALHARRLPKHKAFAWVIMDDSRIKACLHTCGDWSSAGDPPVLVVCNFTPLPRHDYRIGVPVRPADWHEIVNTDAGDLWWVEHGQWRLDRCRVSCELTGLPRL